MEESNEQSNIVKQYKSIQTKSYVNRNLNDPNAIDFSSMTHEQLVIEAKRLQRYVIFKIKQVFEFSSSG